MSNKSNRNLRTISQLGDKVYLTIISDEFESVVVDCWANNEFENLPVYSDKVFDAFEADFIDNLYNYVALIYSERIEAVKQRKADAYASFAKSEKGLIASIQKQEEQGD